MMPGSQSSKPALAGINKVIEEKLKGYFCNLNGDRPACQLYDLVIHEVEKPLLKIVLEAVCWNKLKAAELLGINRNTLSKKLMQHGIKKPK